MADEQDIVDALSDLRQIMQQVAQAQSQTAQAVAQLARSGGARAGGVNAGPQNPNSRLSRLKARVKNQTERSLSIGIARSLLAPGENILSALGQGLAAGVRGIGSGASTFSSIQRGVVNALSENFVTPGNAAQRAEAVLGRAQSAVAGVNEGIVRAGGRISPEALNFQNQVALLRERRVEDFRRRQDGRFTELSQVERQFQANRALGAGEGGANALNQVDAGLQLKEAAQALKDAASRMSGGGKF